MIRLYLQLNEPGSGEITVPLDSAMAANLTAGSWVDLKYNGTVLGGFWVEELDKTYVDSSENAGRKLKASGRGAMAILDDAIVWDWGTPGLENVRIFYTEAGGKNATPMHHKGDIIHQLIHEAIESQTNPSGDVLDRKCFHDSADNHILAHSFSATLDSDGNVWDATENEELEARVGLSLLDLARQFSALGQPTGTNVFELEATHSLVTGVTTFGIHQTPIGVLTANAITHFRVGYNCTQVSNVENRVDIRNAVLTECSDPTSPYSTLTDGTSITAYRRREMLLQAANASSVTEAAKYGQASINALKDPKLHINVRITDAVNCKYGTNYNLGDWVYYDDGTGTEVKYRIKGIQLEWDDNTFLDAVVELSSIFMENEIRSAIDLRKVGAQASGSRLLNQTSTSRNTTGYLTHPPSGDALEGTVLTADGQGRSDWNPVDGGSGTAGGSEHLTELLHMDGLNNGTIFTEELGGTWTPVGNAKTSTAFTKFGPTSALLDGAGDYVHTTSYTATGTGNFTIECWVYPLSYTAGGVNPEDGIFSSLDNLWYGAGLSLTLNSDGTLNLWTPGGTDHWTSLLNTTLIVPLSEWSHIALVRTGDVFSIWVNGYMNPVTLTHAINLTSTTMQVGKAVTYSIGAGYFDGYIDEFACWNNARYSAAFTPPAAPYILTTEVERGTVIQFRRGDVAGLPSLYAGEPFIELDTGKLHVGAFVYADSSGFYPRLLSQAAKPTSGTGATQVDTGELIVWDDSDGSEIWLVFNDAGTVKGIKVETI